jgi:hypothetical protein
MSGIDVRLYDKARMPAKYRILPALVAAVLFRSLVFVSWPQAHFDSDQAITGLMAKHLSELRAFPVFWYGQTYLLGVEAWIAAPVMVLIGPTVTALKLPLLAINVAVALLLARTFVRETGLAPGRAALATLFFALAAPITSAHLLMANGGNVEPLLYIVLIWLLRRRPIWLGLVLGVGFLNREFTMYGFFALVLVEALDRTLLTAVSLRRYALVIGVAVAVWFVFLGLKQISSAAGPGTTVENLSHQLASNDLAQVTGRFCTDWRAIASGSTQILTLHWPDLFGLAPHPLTDFGIESTTSQGLAGSAWLLVLVIGLPIVRTASSRTTGAPARPLFPIYLVVTAVISIAGYLVGRCGLLDLNTMRYELLSILGMCGLAAWYLHRERSRIVLSLWMAGAIAVFAMSGVAHARLIGEYVTSPPVALKQDLVRALYAHHIRYGYADFWTAYYVDFMSREHIILTPEDAVKIRSYNWIVDAHRGEAVHVLRQPCAGGQQLTPAFWSCR